MATTDAEKVQRALDNGILMGSRLMDLCRELDFPYYIACAYLEQESTDPDTGKHGASLWGSDNTWMRGVDLEPIFGDRLVTRDMYLVYKTYRDKPGFGAQGVGPMQLTAPSLQDEADELGGCWKPIVNIRVGLGFIKQIRARGVDWTETARRYNGGINSEPPAGVAYAEHNDQLRAKWRDILG